MLRFVVVVSALLAAIELPGCPGLEGYDCNVPPAVAGLVKVEAPTGRYVIVMRSPAATGRGGSRRRMVEAHTVAAAAAVRSFGATVDAAVLIGDRAYVTASSLPQSSYRTAKGDPRVLFIQEEQAFRINALPWGVDRSDQRGRELDGRYAPRARGQGIDFYVVDTGIDCQHPELGGCGEGFTAIGDSTDDGHGHGTHVAGIGRGMAPGAVLHPVRVLDANGSGTTSTVIAGVAWVAERTGKRVANLSLGGADDAALNDAICKAIAAGVVVVVAAGNESQPACFGSPARVVQAYTVAATDRDDTPADFTNNGPCVDLHAPGVAIPSAWPGGGSRELSGTSMAAPHVAGGVAQCLELEEPIDGCMLERASPAAGDLGGSPDRLLYVGP